MSCKLVQADTLQFDNIIHYAESHAYLYIIKKSPEVSVTCFHCN